MEPADARYAAVDPEAGLYESFYLRAGHPTRPLAAWIRYTVLKRPGREPRGSLWFTLFDREAGPPQATKVTLAPGDLSIPADEYIRIGTSYFGDGRVAGTAGEASWDLSFESDQAALKHLPRAWMYGAPLPRTKLLSLHPAATFDGHVRFGQDGLSLAGWRGMVGHNWGSQHAERWIWLHAATFDGHEDAWFDVALARIRVGRLTLPWVASGGLSVAGKRLRVGGLRRARVDESPESCSFSLSGRDLCVAGEARSPLGDIVAWTYSDPAGGVHETLNCSIAQLEIRVDPPGGEKMVLRSGSGAVYELGARESDHGVPLQPFGDP
ncbi:MAG: hypothetical protein NVSMB25_07160 [Thermoleophilaceae bacterium]